MGIGKGAGINWQNVDLSNAYERSLNMLEPINFDMFLLEIECNERNINKEVLQKHFLNVLQARTEEAKEIFNDNIDNLLKDALKTRNIK